MARPRLLLADDHPGTRELLSDLLGAEFNVIDAVEDGRALVRAAEALSPDVIVTDITMPNLDGIAAAAEVLDNHPSARIVFVTVHSDPCLVKCALSTGALGIVLKLAAGDELVPAVQAALRGEKYVSRALRGRTAATVDLIGSRS